MNDEALGEVCAASIDAWYPKPYQLPHLLIRRLQYRMHICLGAVGRIPPPAQYLLI